jgi:ParB family chromosome partitioning protein
LLHLPIEVQQMIIDARLSAGHARALITSSDPLALARQVEARGLSVRETERLARTAPATSRPRRKPAEKDADTLALESDLAAATGLKVAIDHRADGAGTLTIGYRTLEQLDDLCRRIALA